ncbi:MAG: superoxide dismutase [Ni] [Planctomycetota bacterium]
MNKIALTALAAVILSIGFQQYAGAHCEVPCGIFTDQARFESMLEDTKTIHKAMVQTGELAGKSDAQSFNQASRWVYQKEKHAEKIQEIIARYFMAQRIKTNDPKYVEKLTAAHAVMVAAMKSKQTVKTEQADALRDAILAFHKVYEGK